VTEAATGSCAAPQPRAHRARAKSCCTTACRLPSTMPLELIRDRIRADPDVMRSVIIDGSLRAGSRARGRDHRRGRCARSELLTGATIYEREDPRGAPSRPAPRCRRRGGGNPQCSPGAECLLAAIVDVSVRGQGERRSPRSAALAAGRIHGRLSRMHVRIATATFRGNPAAASCRVGNPCARLWMIPVEATSSSRAQRQLDTLSLGLQLGLTPLIGSVVEEQVGDYEAGAHGCRD